MFKSSTSQTDRERLYDFRYPKYPGSEILLAAFDKPHLLLTDTPMLPDDKRYFCHANASSLGFQSLPYAEDVRMFLTRGRNSGRRGNGVILGLDKFRGNVDLSEGIFIGKIFVLCDVHVPRPNDGVFAHLKLYVLVA